MNPGPVAPKVTNTALEPRGETAVHPPTARVGWSRVCGRVTETRAGPHLGSLRCAGRVDRAGFHTVGFVPATQCEAAFPPPLVPAGQRAVTPEHTG